MIRSTVVVLLNAWPARPRSHNAGRPREKGERVTEVLDSLDGWHIAKPTKPQNPMLKIYVASSWRNEFQPDVVRILRADGHEVYDFKDSEGFHWTEVDPDWQTWPTDIPKYLVGLNHPCAERGFNRDMSALVGCDVCVYVMPCGVSASIEMGYAVGAGKWTIVYVPGLREPDLMVKLAHAITQSMDAVREFVRHVEEYGALTCSGHAYRSMSDSCRIMFGGSADVPKIPDTNGYIMALEHYDKHGNNYHEDCGICKLLAERRNLSGAKHGT